MQLRKSSDACLKLNYLNKDTEVQEKNKNEINFWLKLIDDERQKK